MSQTSEYEPDDFDMRRIALDHAMAFAGALNIHNDPGSSVLAIAKQFEAYLRGGARG